MAMDLFAESSETKKRGRRCSGLGSGLGHVDARVESRHRLM